MGICGYLWVFVVFVICRHACKTNQKKMVNLNYESPRNEKAVAHAMEAVVRQEVATPSDQVQPVNAIAQPMAVLDGEVPVAKRSGHVEGAVRVVNESYSRCDTRGCSLPEIHAGICTSVISTMTSASASQLWRGRKALMQRRMEKRRRMSVRKARL